ncbi:hypothetical protein ACP275_04G217300 [Erythranthe tilingii]
MGADESYVTMYAKSCCDDDEDQLLPENSTDQFMIRVSVSIAVVADRAGCPLVCFNSRNSVLYPRQRLVSGTEWCNYVMWNIIENTQVPFPLEEDIHWGPTLSTNPTSENLSEIISGRLAQFAGDCAANQDIRCMEVYINLFKVSPLLHHRLLEAGTMKREVKCEAGRGLLYRKDENFGEWYSEVVVDGEMIEYYDISGCYILRPWAMSIWEVMQTFFDAEIKKMKIKNCYFPLFVSSGVLQKEKDHIEGFAPEVAWVTKSGESELEMPIAIRPTSETVMYPYFSKWIRGHRDLPLRLNQWCNVVRWEFSNPTPFIRSREFLWQEGHTAFATKKEADTEVLEVLELYRRIYEEFLAVPVIKGKKSEHEKFAGGLYTTSVEAFVPNTGRGIEGATSHSLGQNFAKMFEINFENEKGEKSMVWQNSWACTTRTIGVMIMVHGDDKGLVLPPKVAPLQVVVIPECYEDANIWGIFDACADVIKSLEEAGIRAEADYRDNYSPGWKYSHWEMKGVPLRIEIGPKDLANNQVRAVRRDNSAKSDIPMADLVKGVKDMLNNIQQSLFDAATQKRDACIHVVHTWEEFTEALGEKKMILAPWCDEEEVEKDVKTRTNGEMGAAKSLCTPFDQPALPEGTLCFASGKPAKKWTYWGRSY